jgi:hypothetical protein
MGIVTPINGNFMNVNSVKLNLQVLQSIFLVPRYNKYRWLVNFSTGNTLEIGAILFDPGILVV